MSRSARMTLRQRDVLAQLAGQSAPPRLAEPPHGWQGGLVELVIRGRCPWCGHRLENVGVSSENGVTWSCLEGCNP